jgi:hypothetical protein
METRVRTPHDVFFQPQRLLVPLFQRPYVWSREGQWAPLWEDVRRQADRLLEHFGPAGPHFLGAVVLQNQAGSLGHLPQWTIIDGQQRLTTLQLLLDAAHHVIALRGVELQARQIEDLVRNPAHFCRTPADAFKVWPTNRDREAFNEIMEAALPVDYASLAHSSSRMAQAHQYFSESIADWLDRDDAGRATALTSVLLYQLQFVVIQLGPDEDAQEIFETLNARGAPLSAADLIKNFVFQRLGLDDAQAEATYHKYWQDFETAFWEKEVGIGKLLLPRSSIFLNQWLMAQTGREVTLREVFARFKAYAEHESNLPMATLLPTIHASASTYRSWMERAALPEADLNRLELFAYRTAALDSESAKPLLIWATDPQVEPLPPGDLDRIVQDLESWLVRRALLRLNSKHYTRFLASVLNTLRHLPRVEAAAVVRELLAKQDSPNMHWPSDRELRLELATAPVYRRLHRGRLRMVLEAVEDHLRGFDNTTEPLAGQRVIRDRLVIEHLLPQQWDAHWPLGSDTAQRAERSQVVHTLGNLTLLTGRLNTKVSNGPWLGEHGKWAALQNHDVLLLNRHVRQLGANGWDERTIRQRTGNLIDAILKIWPVPGGHVGYSAAPTASNEVSVGLLDLLSEGFLTSGQTLHSRGKHGTATATVLADGSLQVGDNIYDTPSGATKAALGRTTNGWWFWLTDRNQGTCLRDLRADYAAKFDVEATAADDQDTHNE